CSFQAPPSLDDEHAGAPAATATRSAAADRRRRVTARSGIIDIVETSSQSKRGAAWTARRAMPGTGLIWARKGRGRAARALRTLLLSAGSPAAVRALSPEVAARIAGEEVSAVAPLLAADEGRE